MTTSPSKDPVCGMTVNSQSRYQADYHGKHYVFCCQDCQNKFKKTPNQFAK